MKHLNDKNPQLSFVILRKVLLKQNTQYTAVGSHNSESGHLSGTNAKVLRLQDLTCLRSFQAQQYRDIKYSFYNEKPNTSAFDHLPCFWYRTVSQPEKHLRWKKLRPKIALTVLSRVYPLTHKTNKVMFKNQNDKKKPQPTVVYEIGTSSLKRVRYRPKQRSQPC